MATKKKAGKKKAGTKKAGKGTSKAKKGGGTKKVGKKKPKKFGSIKIGIGPPVPEGGPE